MNQEVFTYNYNAKQNKEVALIREKYLKKERTAMDDLRAMDTEVHRPADIFAYIFGSIAAIIMGAGMSLVMTELGTILGIASAMPIGIALGCVGMVMAIVNYPMHKRILARRREKYGARILSLSDEIMGRE